jgi:hypothetical protein
MLTVNLKRSAMAVLTITALCATLAKPARADIAGTPITDMMGMSVCTDNTGHVLRGMAPTDPACTTTRKLRAGEMPPYRLMNFSALSGPCANQQGVLARTNVPFALDGVTRIVSFDFDVPHVGCTPQGQGRLSGISVQGTDNIFGFIMGDNGPTGQISFDSPPQCRLAPHSAARFSRGWIIGPAILPPRGQPGYTANTGALTPGDPAMALKAGCPSGGNFALTAWVVDSMTFTAGATLPTLVSDHFSRANASGTGPGAAQQMERTYWTVQFGLLRWEHWARADWTGGIAPVSVLARAAQSSGTCTAPHVMPATVAPGLQAGPLQILGGWSQALRDPSTGAQYNWYLVQCVDYSRIDRTLQTVPTALPANETGWWLN